AGQGDTDQEGKPAIAEERDGANSERSRPDPVTRPNVARVAPAISTTASRQLRLTPTAPTNPWMYPGKRRTITWVPASRSARAYSSPSSRSGSNEAVTIRAGGSPDSSSASSGDALGSL